MITVDWVSPLRPDTTDIAEYTVRVEKALSGRFSLNLITNENANDLAAYRFDVGPFYNIGNDVRFHGQILSACQKLSGIVIAHDFRIQNLLIAQLRADHGDWESRYRTLMERHYGGEGNAAAKDFIAGRIELTEVAEAFPGIEIAAANALCVITHNPSLVDDLARRTGLYCLAMPLPFPVPEHIPERQEPSDGRDLLIFGYLGENRGLDVVCELLREHSGIRLHIAGQIGSQRLRETVDDMKAAGHSIVDHGFVTESELDSLVRNSDLVVNLRNPSMGEVSGSQLRIFAQGGLSVVCATGWYADLPEDAVLKVRPERMKPELGAIIERLRQDRHAFDAMRRAGRNFVARAHGLDQFATSFEALYQALPEALSHGRRVLLAKHMAKTYEQAGAGGAIRPETLFHKASLLL
jgi:glycosyltransferase involved in cell wall biosynthesis